MADPQNLEHITVPLEPEEDFISGASKIVSLVRPEWKVEDYQFKSFSEGVSNKVVGIYMAQDKTDMILIRVYGRKTELLVDRPAEIENMKIMSKTGFGGKLYATFANGLAYQYIHGDILTTETVRSPEVFPIVAATVARMHRVASLEVATNANAKLEPCLWKKLRQFWECSPDGFPEDPAKDARYKERVSSKSDREAEINELQEILEKLESPIVFCHNDLLLANIILQPGNKISFIDFEYGDFNYQAFDIADHFCEFAGVNGEFMDYAGLYPNKEFQMKWLRKYLEAYREGEEILEEDIESLYKMVNKFALSVRLFWGNWALCQAQISTIDFDFLGYATQIFDEFKRRKNDFLSL